MKHMPTFSIPVAEMFGKWFQTKVQIKFWNDERRGSVCAVFSKIGEDKNTHITLYSLG